ncbi:MAG: formate dehydrogenase accessory sulfurtransferase FdhD [bacterium]|jgi:FdhD protein|nr:formate dehydrogenase accessory sulfurtransferase FdhD [Betaproteobacteria bacterium]
MGQAVPHARPDLTTARRDLTFDVEALDEHGQRSSVAIAGEHPLTLYVDKRELVTLMTLGQAPEALALGFLRNQRLVAGIDEIAAVHVDWEVDAVAVTTRAGAADFSARTAKRTVTTGCGQGSVFGGLMEEIDAIRLPQHARLSQRSLYALLDAVRRRETVYKQAGAVHGCALARCSDPGGADDRVAASAEVLYYVEDVGRHNAVDAIAGHMWLDRVDGGDKVFYTTGRLTSEMVIKCAQMGVPFLVSRSGLTEMGYRIARQVGLTMIGRAANTRYLLFTGAERFDR